MPARLTDTHLADPCVPSAWRGVLEDLRAFLDCETRLRALERPSEAAEQAELTALHDRLVAGSGGLLEPAAIDEPDSPDLRRLLLRSVLALVHLKQVVVADQPVLDTAGSRTLPLFEADFFGDASQVAEFIARAQQLLALSDEDVRRESTELGRDMQDARRKQALVRAMRDEFNLWPNSDRLREGIVGLFQAIYPDAPVPPEDIEVVVTSTLVFFCLPLSEDHESLTSERFRQLPPDRQATVREFLAHQKRFSQERFASFPAFGHVASEQLDRALLERLAARTGADIATILQELPRLVTVLPQDQIEKYLIHDVWGHGWQASMLRFDNLYDALARFADPLTLNEAAETAFVHELRLKDCFVGAGDRLQLDAERFRAFAIAEVCQRLPVALSAVLAEMLADVAEFKFLAEHPDRAPWLPSSSRLWTYPAMLDLTLADVPFYFGQATKVFRLWSKQPGRQGKVVDELVQGGATPEAAARAVVQAVAIWSELETDYFAPELRWSDDGDQLRVNAYTRVLLNFVGVHRTLLETYQQLSAVSMRGLPLKSFRDLLVLSASVFFEANPARNLWRVDEFLALALLPFCRQLVMSDRD
ncbi:MAG: hypothetical protein SGJ19_29205 [Planctomycetia bacterium]|nr:hypothetical protein [Planctomycetia bacterium]